MVLQCEFIKRGKSDACDCPCNTLCWVSENILYQKKLRQWCLSFAISRPNRWSNSREQHYLHCLPQYIVYLKGGNFREFFYGHFAGINLLRIVFTEDFAGINFCELGLTKDFAGNSRKCPLQRFRGSKFNVRLKEYFFHDLSLWFWEQSQ